MVPQFGNDTKEAKGSWRGQGKARLLCDAHPPYGSGRSSTEVGAVRTFRTGNAPTTRNTRPRAWRCIFRRMALVRLPPPLLARLLGGLSSAASSEYSPTLTCHLLQTAPSANSPTPWPEEVACTSTAHSAATNSAAAATMPFMPKM